MQTEDIVKLVQRADKVSLDSRAAMLVEFDNNGELHIATYGQSMGIYYMKRNLNKLLNNE